MPEFVLDTSGEVPIYGRRSTPNPAEFTRWEHLDAFTQGYIEALFFTENEPGTCRYDMTADRAAWDEAAREGRSKEIPGDYGFSDLAPETLARIIEDCRKFKVEYNAVAMNAGADGVENWPSEEQGGRDFWYTRNGHGCGFWDGDWPEPYASELTAAAQAFAQVDAYLGDDGKVYLS